MNNQQQLQLSLAELELAKIQAALVVLASNSPDLDLSAMLDRAVNQLGAAQDRIVALQSNELRSILVGEGVR